jgi:hypothetical protein
LTVLVLKKWVVAKHGLTEINKNNNKRIIFACIRTNSYKNCILKRRGKWFFNIVLENLCAFKKKSK